MKLQGPGNGRRYSYGTQRARQATARAANTAMVTTYWMIGQRIVVEEQNGSDRADYGEYIRRFRSA